MVEAKVPKQARRELSRWQRLLLAREAGASIADLMVAEDVTQSQVYALLARARDARVRGWLQ